MPKTLARSISHVQFSTFKVSRLQFMWKTIPLFLYHSQTVLSHCYYTCTFLLCFSSNSTSSYTFRHFALRSFNHNVQMAPSFVKQRRLANKLDCRSCLYDGLRAGGPLQIVSGPDANFGID